MIRKTLERFGMVYLMLGGVLMMVTWFFAFFRPENSILVTINTSGEMYPELILHIFGLACLGLKIDSYIRTYIQNRKPYVQKIKAYLNHIEVS